MSIYTYKYSYTCILYQTCSVAHMHAAYIYVCTFVYAHIHMYVHVQPIAFGVIFSFNLQSYSPWSLFNGTWQKRPRELDHRLRFEIEEMSFQMQ